MTILQTLLILFYIFLIYRNYQTFTSGRVIGILTLITATLSILLLFGNNAANLDWSENELDVSGYRTIYEQYDILEYPDFNMYYIFYFSIYIGQQLGLSYRCWWAIMSVLAMLVIFIACKVHKYNYTLFLASFMAYYELVFYSGFKFFYGFCVFLLAYGFLLRNTKKDNILYAIITCLAGGLHSMYYIFLIFLLKPYKRPEMFVKSVVAVTIMFTILMRISGSAMSYMAPFFNAIDNEHVNRYTTLDTVHLSFYIAVILHVILVYIAYRIRKYKIQIGECNSTVDALFYSVLLSLLFCPFYAVALTFMRLLTAFSLVFITASSSVLSDTIESRNLCRNMSLLIVVSFIMMQIVTSGSSRGFIEVSVMPFFDIF